MNNPKTNNGGPTFPIPTKYMGTDFPGMSLRDYFAGQALTGLLADQKRDGLVKAYADDAYTFADAMIAARNS